MGVQHATIEELFHPYIRPQENGNRSDVRYVSFDGDQLLKFTISAHPLLNFSIHYCSLDNLIHAAHITELMWDKAPYFYIDLTQTGLGSNDVGLTPYPNIG